MQEKLTINGKIAKGLPKLTEHRKKFEDAGYKGALLIYSELSEPEKLFITRQFLQKSSLYTHRDPHELFSEICFQWGIMCPHPKTKQEFHMNYSRCGACHALVVLNESIIRNPGNLGKTGDERE